VKSKYLHVALQAVTSAEKIILHYYEHGVDSQLKADLSPVTIADQEAEEAIKAVILQNFPDHTFYGEEGEKVDLTNHRGYTWIIDPIDGTKSFMRHMPLFATQLALLHDGELVLGVSNAPLLKECIYAQKGYGCYMNEQRLQVGNAPSLSDAYASFGGLKYFAKNNTLDGVVALSQQAKWSRGIGDFWSYHLLAQGTIDIMVEAQTKLWDIAALKVIIEEAGGQFTQLDGQPITVDSTTALATNGPVHSAVLDLFKSI
jgi:histidinol-phosphatase